MARKVKEEEPVKKVSKRASSKTSSKKSTSKRSTKAPAKSSRTKKAPVKSTRATKTTGTTKAKTPRAKKVLTPRLSPETPGEFYKAFRATSNPDVLHSASVYGILGLDYPKGEITSAKPELVSAGFGIMIFEKLEDARSWGGGSNIYKVKVGRVFDVPAKRLHRSMGYRGLRDGSLEGSKLSWSEIASLILDQLDVTDSWPRGTKMCDWVIPVEQV